MRSGEEGAVQDLDLNDAYRRAAAWIAQADGLIITAGAGMGVDSGLPDFRGPNGFWNSYPALGRECIRFEDIASPRNFRDDPALAWGFYGHRLNLYRATLPHEGFDILRKIAERMPEGGFVITTNVDGQFQKAGFSIGGVVEVHGSIHHLQCQNACMSEVWSAGAFRPAIDEGECRLRNSYPRCPHCGAIARPNILMFDDVDWVNGRTDAQWWEYQEWRANVHCPVVIELGAGTRIASIRAFGEHQGCPLVRINISESQTRTEGSVSLAVGAREGIRRIAAYFEAEGLT